MKKLELEVALAKAQGKVERLTKAVKKRSAQIEDLRAKVERQAEEILEYEQGWEEWENSSETAVETNDRLRQKLKEMERKLIQARAQSSVAHLSPRSSQHDDEDRVSKLKTALLREREQTALLQAELAHYRATYVSNSEPVAEPTTID